VLFGSNWPMIPPSKCLEHLDLLGLSEDTKRCFLYENAERVFNLSDIEQQEAQKKKNMVAAKL
jgi:predicted TIM-barrel fold metal-dependent hydrolase